MEGPVFYCLYEYYLHIVDNKTVEAEYLYYCYLESLTIIR